MKNIIFYYPLLLLFLASLTFAYKNTTDFWKSQLNTEIHFQAYSGLSCIIKVINLSIGTFPTTKPNSSTKCSLPTMLIPSYHLHPLLSSFGCREDLVAVLSWEHSLS